MYYLILIIILSSCAKNMFSLINKEKELVPHITQEGKKIFSTEGTDNLLLISTDQEFINSVVKGNLNDKYKKEFPVHLYIYSNKSLEEFKALFKYLSTLKSKISSNSFKKYINGYDEKGLAPIHLAVLFKRFDIIKFLLSEEAKEFKIKVNNITSNEYLTSLSLAISLGVEFNKEDKNNIISIILEKKKNGLSILDSDSISSCGYAALKNNLELVKFLIENKGYQIQEEEIDPIMLAVLNNNSKVANYIFSKKYHEKWSNSKKLEFVNYLFTNSDIKNLKNGLDEEYKSIIDEYIEEYTNKRDEKGKSPLIYALENQNEGKIKEVVPNFENKIRNSELIFEICKNNEVAALKELIELEKKSNRNINFEIINKKLETPLHIALKNKSYDVASVLISEMKNFIHFNKNNLTYFHLVAEKANSNLFEKLLERCKKVGTNLEELINKKNKAQNTVLHIAARKGLTNIVKRLLENNANVDEINEDKRTPLHNASKNDRDAIVEMLLKNKAKVNEQDIDGFTPLHYASFNENINIIRLLMSYNADPSIVNKEGKIAKDLTNNLSIIEELEISKKSSAAKEVVVKVQNSQEFKSVMKSLKDEDIVVKFENLNVNVNESSNENIQSYKSQSPKEELSINDNSRIKDEKPEEYREKIEIKVVPSPTTIKKDIDSNKEFREIVDVILKDLELKGQKDIENLKKQFLESKTKYTLDQNDKNKLEEAISKISSNISDLLEANEDNLKAAGIENRDEVIGNLEEISKDLKTIISQ